MPENVLSIEGLGSALDGTRPARIVRWVAPHASKPKPPARAAKQLVPARPALLCAALLRRATKERRLGKPELVSFVSSEEARLLTTKMTFQRVDKEPFLLADASMLDQELEFILPSRSVRALAASEAGRTARADAATNFVALALICIWFAACEVQAFESQLLKAR